MTAELLIEQHLEILSVKGDYKGSSEPIYVKIPHCWKSHLGSIHNSYGKTYHMVHMLVSEKTRIFVLKYLNNMLMSETMKILSL